MSDLEVIHHLAGDVLGCVCEALNATAEQLGTPGCPCRACVVPGPAVADDCCDHCQDGDGGTLNVTVDRLFPTDPFPEPLRPTRWDQCWPSGLDLAVDLTVTLFRCTPTMDAQGRPPSCEQLEAAARLHHVDGWSLWRGVACCLAARPGLRRRGPRFVMAPMESATGGGCQGWALKVTVALDQSCPCPPPQESP